MSRLRILVLGGMTVVGGGSVLPIAGSCRPVLGYLLTHRRRRISRIELAETLWGMREREYSRRCLSTALWRLKRSIGASALVAFHGSDEVSFDSSASNWVDCIALETRVAPLLKHTPAALSDAELGRLERGLRLYRGHYLIGIDDEWALLERHRLRSLYCGGLHLLMLARAARSEWHQVLEWGRQLTREEPLREDVHRLLMLAYSNTGNRASALALYRQCERDLAADLGVEPMPETRELYRQLSQSAALPSAGALPARVPFPTAAPHPLSSVALVKRRIARVKQALAASQRQLDKAIEGLDPLRPPTR